MFVRTASDRDVEAIRALLVEIDGERSSIASLTQCVARPRSEFLVADDGKTLGGVAYAEADETGEMVTLRQLYVLPAMQGGGIGGMLLDEVIESFPEAKRFMLEVEQANVRAIQLYAAHGFVEAGIIDEDGHTLLRMVLEADTID